MGLRRWKACRAAPHIEDCPPFCRLPVFFCSSSLFHSFHFTVWYSLVLFLLFLLSTLLLVFSLFPSPHFLFFFERFRLVCLGYYVHLVDHDEGSNPRGLISEVR